MVKGRGWGHGVGMSQYGAYGLAQHGRGYREILHHYYRHTRIGHAGSNTIKVLLGSGSGSVSFSEGEEGLRQAASPPPRLPLQAVRLGRDPASAPIGAGSPTAAASGIATGGGTIRIGGKGVYRGRLKATASDGGLLVINAVGLEAYVKGVVPNEVPSSWPQAALRAQTVAARSYALATERSGRLRRL